jgi:hypothetical protein
VEAIEIMINEVPEGKDAGLIALAEFIEDCSYSALHIKVACFLLH